MLGRVMGAARAWIKGLEGLDWIGSNAAIPALQFMAEQILAEIPELKPG
jgi:hypothetical protein